MVDDLPECYKGVSGSGALSAVVELKGGVGIELEGNIGKLDGDGFKWAFSESSAKVTFDLSITAAVYAKLAAEVKYSFLVSKPER